METKRYIGSLFAGYENSPVLEDFKEELESNLNERIQYLKNTGLAEEEAYKKATAELGDVSILADELSLKRKQEVFSEMYMKTRKYMNPWRVGLYVLSGAVLGFGAIVSACVWFLSYNVMAPFGTALLFGEIGILGFVFLGLTQETAVHKPMCWKRALWYVIATGVFIFGVFVFIITYFSNNDGLPHAIASLIPFALPSLALGVFLILTEKNRNKPWVIEQQKKVIERDIERFGGIGVKEHFGFITGALWIGAIAGFVVLLITVGIKFAWLAFVAALIGQLIIMASLVKKD